MTRSLAFKLTLSFWLVSLTGVALVAFFSVRVTASEFDVFLDARERATLATQLADYFAENGRWRGVDSIVAEWNRNGRNVILTTPDGRVVTSHNGDEFARRVPPNVLSSGTPIEVNGRLVGILTPGGSPPPPIRDALLGQRNDFLARTSRAVVLAALGATAVSLLLGIVLARTLTRPVQELTTATRAVAQGELNQQVSVHSDDELGQLARAFNQMSADLARAQSLRRQMTADIAHDLRTPLSLILGHAEALSEGVLPPAKETFHVIHDEARRLNRLIEDLRTLSLAEAGNLTLTPRPVAPIDLLARAVTAHTPAAQQKQITLRQTAPDTLPAVTVDPDRIAQVFDNLLTNAIRHTPAGGTITLAAKETQNNSPSTEHGLQFSITDTGPGIPEEDLPNVFERFYRADRARHRSEGGSGLGLAIAKSIVQAHNGRIWAESTPGTGTTFSFTLPLAK